MDLLYDEIMLYHDERLLDRYVEDKMSHPEGMVGKRFGLAPTGNHNKQYPLALQRERNPEIERQGLV
jgi:hypothetical protein